MTGIISGNGLITVLNAGHGTTPDCPEATYRKGQVIERRNVRWLAGQSRRGAVAAVVPAGFPPEWAIADAFGEPRPLVTSIPGRTITYVVGFEDNPRPFLLKDRHILKATSEMTEVQRAPGAAP